MIRRESLSQSLCTLAACVLIAALGCADAAEHPAGPPPNVVLVVIDTARADHFSLYGYGRDTSPRLAAFAREASVFERASSTSPWTVASHASLFTGLLPVTHGATQEHLRLDAPLETLAGLLAARGYATAAFSNNSWVSGVTDLTRGFDLVREMWREAPRAEGAPHPTNVAALEWLRQRDPARPFLLFVNYIEPHWPYEAPPSYQDRFVGPHVAPKYRERSDFSAVQWYLSNRKQPPKLLETRRRMYDAEIAWVDDALGDLLDGLDAQGLLDPSLVIVTSDHGESLGDHGHQGHSFALFEPLLHVPLVIRPPGGGAGQRRRDPVQITDVFATIARAAGAQPSDSRVVGRDLLGEPLPADRPIVAEYYRPDMFLRRFPDTEKAKRAVEPYRRRLRSIRVGDHKLIWSSDGRRRLYDLSKDPQESRSLMKHESERAQVLEAQLDALVQELGREVLPVDPGTLDPETEANLRALGYL